MWVLFLPVALYILISLLENITVFLSLRFLFLILHSSFRVLFPAYLLLVFVRLS